MINVLNRLAPWRHKVAKVVADVWAWTYIVFWVVLIFGFVFVTVKTFEPALSLLATTTFIGGLTVCAVRRGWTTGGFAMAGVAISFVGYGLGPIHDVTLPAKALLISQLVWGAGVIVWFIAIAPCFQSAIEDFARTYYSTRRRSGF